MLTLAEGKLAVSYARAIVDTYVRQETPDVPDLPPPFDRKAGAFVTLNTFPSHQLRGCIGIPEPVMCLHEAIRQGAQSATHDPRFPPLSTRELDEIVVEVTILTPPQRIMVTTPDELLHSIVIGRDGLIAERGPFRGLLLPQVPVDHGWDVRQYLSHTCQKAGLPPDAWQDDDVTFHRFEGAVYAETAPRGPAVHKELHESC
jgi:uncharacterized protein (TIGR00296 family)